MIKLCPIDELTAVERRWLDAEVTDASHEQVSRPYLPGLPSPPLDSPCLVVSPPCVPSHAQRGLVAVTSAEAVPSTPFILSREDVQHLAGAPLTPAGLSRHVTSRPADAGAVSSNAEAALPTAISGKLNNPNADRMIERFLPILGPAQPR